MKRIMLAAMASNSGKTSLMMALLAGYLEKGIDIRSFKTGPDYIDPMFHEKILGLSSRNLDPYMMDQDLICHLISKDPGDLALIEGVMGYYDGIGSGTDGSSYSLAQMTKTPVVLVLKPKGIAASLGAQVQGMVNFKKDSNIKGVILNGLSAMMYGYYKKIIEDNTGLKVYGYLKQMDHSLESRHLGLITADEVEDLKDLIREYGEEALKTIDLEGLMALASTAPDLEDHYREPEKIAPVRLALARDLAYSFYYQDGLDYLRKLGADLLEFSPLKDEPVPEGVHGLYLGGGYPEVYIEKLSKNQNFLDSLRKAHRDNMPIFAECGGFMTLFENFKGEDKTYPLAGLIQGSCWMTDRLQHFGYIDLEAQEDCLIASKGDHIRAHEFHYSTSSVLGETFQGKKPQSKRGWSAFVSQGNLCGGYPHIHLMANPKAARKFVEHMRDYKEMTDGKGNDGPGDHK